MYFLLSRDRDRNRQANVCCRSPRGRPLQWRHNELDSISNHQPHHCLLSRLFGCTSKKTPKLRVTGLCAGNSPGIGEFPAQIASYAENVSIWWRHHAVRGEPNISTTPIEQLSRAEHNYCPLGLDPIYNMATLRAGCRKVPSRGLKQNGLYFDNEDFVGSRPPVQKKIKSHKHDLLMK